MSLIEQLLLLFYLLLGCWIVPKFPFVKKSKLTAFELRLLLLLKLMIAWGVLIYLTTSGKNPDYIKFNNSGKEEYLILIHTPQLFLQNLIKDAREYGFGRFFETDYSFWGYLRFNLLFKLLAILDIFTFGNFYINTFLFCFTTFFANIALYRVYHSIFKENKSLVLISTFFLPTSLLFTTCVHKDGVVFIALSAIVFILFKFSRQFSASKIEAPIHLPFRQSFFSSLILGLSFAIIFLIRNYVLVALIPALFAWWLSNRLPIKKVWTFLYSYATFICLFCISTFFSGSANLANLIINRRFAFAKLRVGHTNIQMNNLQPNLKSFLYNLPQAINHALLRPYVWEFSRWDVFLTALEPFLYLIIFIAFLFWGSKKMYTSSGFLLFGLFFFGSMMLVIGYTIPNIGAIVRYRSIFWVFLICPMLCSTDWKRISRYFTRFTTFFSSKYS